MFVTCSKWLEKEARKSAILAGQQVRSIPNPIDTHVFHPADSKQARIKTGLPLNKKIILFASQRVTNVNKGISFLVEHAINWLRNTQRWWQHCRGYTRRACRGFREEFRLRGL